MEILIYSSKISARLQFICEFIFTERMGLPFTITTNAEAFKKSTGIKINYSEADIQPETFNIFPAAILFQTNITAQNIECFTVQNNKAFFKMDKGDIAFDIFAASFYLLSRYEEYLPHSKDIYGRYAHENSLAFKEDFLKIPLINIWINNFKAALKNKFSTFTPQKNNFTFTPTYDIDIAYAYKYKGWVKNIGGFLKRPSLKRMMVLSGFQQDPFDVYDELIYLHKKYNLHPIYFFLLADKNKKYDKNISPDSKSMKDIIKKHAAKYRTGIHPSWQSGDDEQLLVNEINKLQLITKNKIHSSRQHYIRFTIPQTFRRLISAGIKEDYSMGYGSINGFRASVASTFFWFDLEKNEQTSLRIFPFCFMDANSFYEQKLQPAAALKELMEYYLACKNADGNLITIWHNNIIGDDKMFSGWGDIYKNFIAETCNGK